MDTYCTRGRYFKTIYTNIICMRAETQYGSWADVGVNSGVCWTNYVMMTLIIVIITRHILFLIEVKAFTLISPSICQYNM